MHRPGRRTFVGVRISPAGLAQVRELAAAETQGNLSAMIRTLLSEAVRARRRPQPTRNGKRAPSPSPATARSANVPA